MAKGATTQAVVRYRRNLILDKVSGDPVKLRADMEAFKQAGYWVELRFVDRPLEVALPDMVTRFEETGCWIPPHLVAQGHAGVARAFHENADFADRATLRVAAAGERHKLVYDTSKDQTGRVCNEGAYQAHRQKGGVTGEQHKWQEVTAIASQATADKAPRANPISDQVARALAEKRRDDELRARDPKAWADMVKHNTEKYKKDSGA